MTAVRDMDVDLMHALRVYSRVMMGGGGGVITKCSKGGRYMFFCIFYP